jgi:hypothetical protein
MSCIANFLPLPRAGFVKTPHQMVVECQIVACQRQILNTLQWQTFSGITKTRVPTAVPGENLLPF